MDESKIGDSQLLMCLDRLNRRQEVRFWIPNPDMNFVEARFFLELTHRDFSGLVRNGLVPFRKKGRARIFNKNRLNLWLVQICFMPDNEMEQQIAEHFIKRGRVRL
jgi:hypothetical protein